MVHLAGIAALVLSKHPELTPFQLKSVLYLTATNVASGMIESVGILLGPLVAGVLLRVSDPATVFFVMGSLCILGAD